MTRLRAIAQNHKLRLGNQVCGRPQQGWLTTALRLTHTHTQTPSAKHLLLTSFSCLHGPSASQAATSPSFARSR
jgi:hypothetical protein